MTISLSMYDTNLFKEYLSAQKGLMDSSIQTYVGVINQFLVEADDLESLEDYNSFLVKYTIKKRCAYYYNVIRGFIEWKIEDEKHREFLIQNLVRPQIRTDFKYERKYLTEEKIISVINALKEEKHTIIGLMQTLTGARAGDIMRLKMGNILPEEYEGKPVLRVNILGKGKKRNVAYIHDLVAYHIILNYLANLKGNVEGYYFLSLGNRKGRRGNATNEYRLYRMCYLWYWIDLKQALQTCGVNRADFATHDLRRCFARRAWEKFKDIHILQQLLHHNDPATTVRYLVQSGLSNIDRYKEMQNG